MMEPKDIVVGMEVRAGVAEPRTVRVCEPPFTDPIGRWRALVEYRTGEKKAEPLSFLHHVPKRASVRRGREPKACLRPEDDTLRGPCSMIVAEFNEFLPDDERVTDEYFERLKLKNGHGGGR